MSDNAIEINRLQYIIRETLKDKNLSNNIFSKQLLDLDELANNSTIGELEVELKLEKVSFEFRQSWLQYASKISSKYFRSPFYADSISLPNSKDIKYDYERVANTRSLDNRCMEHSKELRKWETDCTFFANGMSSIHIVLSQLFIYIRNNGTDIPKVSVAKGSYFETIALFRFLRRQGGFEVDYLEYENILNNISSGTTDIVFLEPVLCDLVQTVLDFNLLVEAIKNRDSSKLLFVIIDTSIVGSSFEMEFILNQIDTQENIVFIDVLSGLKLFQEGLEFTNVGFTKIYTLKGKYIRTLQKTSKNSIFKRSASDIKKQFGRLRKVYGVGLSLEQFHILDAMWFLNPDTSKKYMNTIHENNLFVAQELAKANGIFKDVFHPGLSTLSQLDWAKSPSVVLTFNEDDDNEENMELLKKIILFEIKKANITLYWGTSFGFRHHRFEIINFSNQAYESEKERHIVRLPIGYRKGYSLKYTLKIFLKIANHKTFLELKNNYINDI
ncbi:hypothetical protein [Sulfurimonas sp.]